MIAQVSPDRNGIGPSEHRHHAVRAVRPAALLDRTIRPASGWGPPLGTIPGRHNRHYRHQHR